MAKQADCNHGSCLNDSNQVVEGQFNFEKLPTKMLIFHICDHNEEVKNWWKTIFVGQNGLLEFSCSKISKGTFMNE